MAEYEDRCAFRVNVPGLGNIYWLFDLPDDGSPIVKRYTKILTESCDLVLANSDFVKSIVNGTVTVLQTCSKTDVIRLGSQCNRLTKYIEATAVYLCHFKDIAMYLAEKLHYSMQRLYYDRPSRHEEAKLTLNAIADTSSIVLQATEKQLSLLTKLSDVTHESVRAFMKAENLSHCDFSSCALSDLMNGSLSHPDDAQTLALFNEAVQKLFVLWSKLAERLRPVFTMTNEINDCVQHVQVADESFDEFATKVVKVSANWIALRKMASKFINHLTPSKLREDVEDTLPQCFDASIPHLSAHFKDIEVRLLADSDHDLDMERSIQIYGSWVQPKLDTTVYRCSELAQEAKDLISLKFDSTKASERLVEIEQQSKHIAIMTTIYLKRLRVIESYAERQQENMMRNTVKLESEIKVKEEKLREKENDLNKSKQQHTDRKAKKKEIESRKKEAEKKKKDLSAKMRKLKERSLKYICTKELLKCSEEEVQKLKDKVHSNEAYCKRLIDSIKNTESQLRRLDKDIENLSQKIQKLKEESDYSFERLKEMKAAIADLKKSIHSWDILLTNAEHGEDRAMFVSKLLHKASKSKSTKKVLGSSGMETALSNFIDAFTAVEHLFSKQWQYVICYDYSCDMCHEKQRGLPLPVDANTVVCCSCAKALVE